MSTRRLTPEQAAQFTAQLSDSFRDLSGDALKSLQTKLGQSAVGLAQAGVRSGTDPYGNAWKPIDTRFRTGRPLRDTGNNIQRSWTAKPATQGRSFDFGSRFRYLATHQYGATIRAKNFPYMRIVSPNMIRYYKKVVIPRRQLVPEMDTGGLGKKWTSAFSRVVYRHMVKLFSQSLPPGTD